MLTRGRVLAVAAATALLSAPGVSAWADGGVNCPPGVPQCTVSASGPGQPGSGSGGNSGGGGGDAAKCYANGNQVPCYRDDMGWFNPFDSCYYQLMNPQPPANDPIWQGPIAVYAKAYEATCPYSSSLSSSNSGVRILSTPPPGFGGLISPAALAQRAVDSMNLTGADIGTAPKAGAQSLVGLPVWLWNNVSATTWGPNSASASAAGVTVTATAQVDHIDWSTGDGASVTCNGPGKPYDPSYGTQQPDCGHTYTRPGKYAITATSHWTINWKASTGESGQLQVDRTSTASVDIAEAQALNTQ